MTLISPILDAVLALLIVVGSPSLGYILIRFAFPFTSKWLGWKRVAAAGIVGVGWSVLLIWAFLPAITVERISPQMIGEWSWWVGLGMIVLITIFRGAYHISIHGMMHPAMMRNSAAVENNTRESPPTPEMEYESETEKEKPPIYKPAQIRPSVSKPLANVRQEMDEPILENDVLDLLKAEKPASESTPTPAREESSGKMVAFGTPESFEDTLDQLKKDLKDFNESMNKAPHKRGQPHE